MNNLIKIIQEEVDTIDYAINESEKLLYSQGRAEDLVSLESMLTDKLNYLCALMDDLKTLNNQISSELYSAICKVDSYKKGINWRITTAKKDIGRAQYMMRGG